MSERMSPEPRPAADDVDRDLRSHHAVTGEHLASLASHVHAARNRAERGRGFMSGFKWVRWTAAAGVAAAVVLVLTLVPVSYNKTTGNDLALTISAPGLSQNDVRTLAERFGKELGGDPVKVTAEAGDQGDVYTLHGFVPAGSAQDANAVGQAFVGVLKSSGYAAAATVTPRVERVSGSVYAMARDQVIRISSDGKTAAELEAEIRDRLIEVGLPNPEVSVTDADGRREIKVLARVESDDPSQMPLREGAPSIVLTKDGQDIEDAERCEVAVRKIKHDDVMKLQVDVNYKGSTAQAVVENFDQLGDAGVASAIESQLHAAGLTTLQVKVTNGEIEIKPLD